ncbi:MAG: OPT/YSL family transporter [Candidatus Eisenbacteria bacterium]|uniref:OPT/YSL family transporter n=1 Tax=Eiseniibacteriota bacterium TaxID=2212470 RepID=A0A933W2W0_UNCEI|nr:OPT/YSL family transporter [Candidatus Eisenbacteria bacterium]
MAIESLTEEQVRTWTRAQKDRWWLQNVYRGDMPQLTFRAALTGFILGGLLSATNLYVGAMTGWSLGVGLTSVILSFAIFRVFARLGANDMTVLENNATQSVATAAGYMTGPLISGMAAYMWIENRPMPWLPMLGFNVVLSLLGVLVAFPMKRLFINDEQQPFPQGRACGVVLDTLYSADAAVGLFKARALAGAAAIAGTITFLSGENYMKWLQERVLGRAHAWKLPRELDAWYYDLVEKGSAQVIRLANVDIRQLGLRPAMDFAMFGAGGLMGIRTASSMMLGMVVNFVILVPWMIALGEILPKSGSVAEGTAVFGRVHVVNSWSLWWGIAIMVTASLVSLFAKPQIFVDAFRMLTRRRAGASSTATEPDVLADIELPLWVSYAGIPVVGGIGVWMAWYWFGVHPLFGALAIPLIVLLTLIAARSTAMTSITPTGALSKIPQFTFGAMDPTHPPTNLMTGVMCVEVSSNASNLLMDIKPGYMLGAKPRQQAIGHAIGIFAGALASTPLFYLLFLSEWKPGMNLQAVMAPEGGQFSFPSAVQWKGVSELVTSIFAPGGHGTLLTGSILTSMIVAAAVGLVFEVARIVTKNRFPLSPLAIGLGVLVPPDSVIAMFAGASFFAIMEAIYGRRRESFGNKLWLQTHEPICAGLVAGAALVGIGDTMIKVFVLR